MLPRWVLGSDIVSRTEPAHPVIPRWGGGGEPTRAGYSKQVTHGQTTYTSKSQQSIFSLVPIPILYFNFLWYMLIPIPKFNLIPS
jgi:hypothetical protein